MSQMPFLTRHGLLSVLALAGTVACACGQAQKKEPAPLAGKTSSAPTGDEGRDEDPDVVDKTTQAMDSAESKTTGAGTPATASGASGATGVGTDTTAASGAGTARPGAIGKQDRVVVFINSALLSQNVMKELGAEMTATQKFLYKNIGEVDFGRRMHARLDPAYRQVFEVSGEQATLDNLAVALEKAAADEQTKVVDLVVNVHGAPGGVLFYDAKRSVEEISTKLKAMQLKGKLRMAYTVSCFGETTMDAWINAGFRVIDGAKGVNSTGIYEAPSMMTYWTDGLPYGEALQKAKISKLVEGAFDFGGNLFTGQKNASNSEKVTKGDTSLTISTP